MLTLVLLGAALAADTDRLPLQAPVTLPDCPGCEAGEGVFRIQFHWPFARPSRGTTVPGYGLLGPDGAVIPIAVARGGDGPERAVLSDWLLVGGNIIAIEEQDRPIDGIVIDVPPLTLAEVDVQAWRIVAALGRHDPHLASSVEGARDQDRVPGDAWSTPRPGEARFPEWAPGRPSGWMGSATARARSRVSVRLPVASAVLEEDGWSRYVVPLPGRFPSTRSPCIRKTTSSPGTWSSSAICGMTSAGRRPPLPGR